jgi:hypothetical protein
MNQQQNSGYYLVNNETSINETSNNNNNNNNTGYNNLNLNLNQHYQSSQSIASPTPLQPTSTNEINFYHSSLIISDGSTNALQSNLIHDVHSSNQIYLNGHEFNNNNLHEHSQMIALPLTALPLHLPPPPPPPLQQQQLHKGTIAEISKKSTKNCEQPKRKNNKSKYSPYNGNTNNYHNNNKQQTIREMRPEILNNKSSKLYNKTRNFDDQTTSTTTVKLAKSPTTTSTDFKPLKLIKLENVNNSKLNQDNNSSNIKVMTLHSKDPMLSSSHSLPSPKSVPLASEKGDIEEEKEEEEVNNNNNNNSCSNNYKKERSSSVPLRSLNETEIKNASISPSLNIETSSNTFDDQNLF